MKTRNLVFLALAILIVTVYVMCWTNNKSPAEAANSSQPVAMAPAGCITNQPYKNPQNVTKDTIATIQAPPYHAPLAERLAWWKEMAKKDWHFEYKMPISFYGKVVDDQNQPIAGAKIKFSWFDMSSEGTGQKLSVSDASGLFSLIGATGKSLGVHVSKEGFKCRISKNKFSFENGILSDDYYDPNPTNPVVFVLRKDRQGEALIVRARQEAQLESGGQSKSFPIGAGDAFVSVERLPEATPHARYWNARITVPDGGLQLTTEEFPYEAPEDGYTNNFIITNGLSVQGNTGGVFYVKSAKGYGRVVVYYVPNMPWIYVESWFNPNPKSRNLEVDPSKVIKR